ncbi:Ig-like domain-containing protein [Lutimaribacter pacificus]|nr:Ig-like domain-containing protein [Lutimaribacter pacificus]
MTKLAVPGGAEMSLNLRQMDLQGFSRIGNDLEIVLADGRVILLEDYYVGGEPAARLFISADGYLSEVTLAEGSDGVLYAQYGPTEQWGKWSPSDDLIFVGDPEVAVADAYAAGDNEVSMLGAALLGGGGLGGLAAGGAAALGGAALLAGGDGSDGGKDGNGGAGDGGGTGGTDRIVPTVNEKGVIEIGGDEAVANGPSVSISGTGAPGATVDVTIGGESESTTVGDDGTWEVTFDDGTFPADGSHDTAVVVTDPDGHVTGIEGPDVVIDTTAPELGFTDGTRSVGDITNGEDHTDGVEIAGTGEPGASVSVVVGGASYDTVVGGDGTWGVVVDTATLGTGEYEAGITVTTTDSFGNSAVFTDSVVIDTQSFIEISPAPVTSDNVVNHDERLNDGVTLTGTTEPGASVEITLGGVTRPAQVDGSGNWSVTFPAGDLPTGETTADVLAVTTDAAGNTASTTGSVRFDTEVRNFTLGNVPGGADGVINAAEADAGLVVSGTTEPGSRVTVQLGQAVVQASVDDQGVWTATIPQGQIARGEYIATMTVTSTDMAENVATITEQVRVDTDAGILTLSQAPIEGDNVINAQESLDGVVIRGTADPGATVQVSLGGVTRSTVADGNGNWQRLFTHAEIPADTDSAPIVATTTDDAGNTRTVTGSVGVDTVVESHSLATSQVAGDGVINAAEQSGIVEVTGTVEPGSVVTVTIANIPQQAVVQPDGSWTARFPAGALPTGEGTLDVTVRSVDRHGNVATLNDTVELDTYVNQLNTTGDPTGGDGVVNLAEAQAGLSLSGQVEPGSGVLVTVAGMSYEATVTAGGHWTLDLPFGAIPAGQDSVDLDIAATDAAGNTHSITQTLALDFDVPDVPIIEDYTRNVSGYSAISVDLTENDVTVYEVDHGVPGAQVGGEGLPIDVLGVERFGFTPEIADGSHLIVQSTDAAGNSSGTYLVLDEASTSQVDLSNPALGAFNIEAIDLQFAEDSQLTLTEAQIKALSANTDTLVISGGVDDTVTITGATHTGQSQTVGGQVHDVYTLGDATVLIDDDITTVI